MKRQSRPAACASGGRLAAAIVHTPFPVLWRARARRLFQDDAGQAAIETLLVAGVVTVALVAALITGFQALMPDVVGYICPLVDPAAVAPTDVSQAPLPSAPKGCFGP
jgi:Flp pilus assembly pilin Flp